MRISVGDSKVNFGQKKEGEKLNLPQLILFSLLSL